VTRQAISCPCALAADSCSGLRETVLRLTAGFSGLKFSVTRAHDGLRQQPLSQWRHYRRRASAASLTACGLPTRLSFEGTR